jgi:23S rRNA pseudouridine955/2504/2580 synthase
MPSLRVTEDGAGLRLDRYLRKVLKGMPLSHIYKLLRTRKVRINGKRAKSDQALRKGDEIILHMDRDRFEEDARRRKKKIKGFQFKVVFEDEHLLVVSKPPFLPVHPGAGHFDNSLIDQIHAYLEVGTDPGPFRPSLAHRLDRDTSGLMLVGKSAGALRELNGMFLERKVRKAYLALAKGTPTPAQGIWRRMVERRDLPGTIRPKSRGRPDATGSTAYRIAVRREIPGPDGNTLSLSLLLLQLITGKTHQIRSHLYQIGCPLLGDPRYGDPILNRWLSERYQLHRQFLHAFRLDLEHPVTKKPLSFVDAYPEDLLPLTEALRLGIPAIEPGTGAKTPVR